MGKERVVLEYEARIAFPCRKSGDIAVANAGMEIKKPFVDVTDEPPGGSSVDGPLPENIHGERSYRDIDAAGDDTDEGFDADEIADQVGDGDDVPQDGDVDFDDHDGDTDTDDDSGPVAENIVRGRGPVALGPHVVLPDRSRPRR